MSILQMSEEEKKKISEQHKNAVKKDNNKKTELKLGLKQPDKKEVKKPS